METHSLLVLNQEEEQNRICFMEFEEQKLPEYINGESGFHVYHVRMLTELLLRQLVQDGQVELQEEEILFIAAASALHDIGKLRIPESILNYPGKLSPLEYDIVKKHAVFGEEMIEEANKDGVPETVIQYAKQIARYHHERIDGTGYPDGKKGEEIPIWAQVVSLADAYDALTSKRNYKQAFSQDVAVQMIASGMCGVFQETLVQGLLDVVNHHSLCDLREYYEKQQRVVESNDATFPKKILCIGNTKYLDEAFLEKAFPESTMIMVFGNEKLSKNGRFRTFRWKKPSVEDAFNTYEFDGVVYFARELSYGKREESDTEQLKETLRCAAKAEKQIPFLYLSSLDSQWKREDGSHLLSASKEKLCEFYENKNLLDVKIIRVPYLYKGDCEQDFLYDWFEQRKRGRTISIEELPGNSCCFLARQDLAELICRVFDNWKSGGGILNVEDGFGHHFSDLVEGLEKFGKGKMTFTGNEAQERAKIGDKVLRNQYGWFAKISILEDLEEEYRNFLAVKEAGEISWWERLQEFWRRHSKLLRILEFVLLFVLTETLTYLTGSTVMFSIVDFRMAYIVIMALTHGLRYGLGAAALSSLAWIVGKMGTGTNWLTLFYEPTNWLAFVYYFLIGSLSGYVKIRSENQIRFDQEEIALLEEKLSFTREIYEDTYEEKRDLKKQILGSKDSFGKIFDITKKLDAEEPHLLYLRIIETFEQVLENRSIAVYSINEEQIFGRLEAASRDIMGAVTRSISMEQYREVLSVVSRGEVWKNTDLRPDLPMYAAGVMQEEKVVLLLFIWHTNREQQTLYYVNLFKILNDLAQMSLLRAFRYHAALGEQRYLPGTKMMHRDVFAASLENYRELAKRKISGYVLLGIQTHGQDFQQIYEDLAKVVRSNDLLGILDEQQVGILLTQATKEDLPYVLPRLEGTGHQVTVLE